jgi:tetratricopeptide (TPR) repeat protein
METRLAAAPRDFARLTLDVLRAALIAYAFLAGLRSLSEFDLGWQMATGRWIVEHRQIPSVDVFSYTANGKPWIYPAGSGLIFYLAYLVGGWPILSWLNAAACAGTLSILLRHKSLSTAVLAVLAIPAIAIRTRPRADMFTVILFAAFLTLLWEQYRSGRARLWLLPLLMVFWVNLHLGFVAGLAAIVGYVGLEALAMITVARRADAAAHLRRAWPWLLATFPAILLNPWPFGIVGAMLPQGQTLSHVSIPEWSGMQLNWTTLWVSLPLREPGSALYLLLLIAALAAVLALLRQQWGEASWLAGAATIAVQHIRFEALFAIIVVVVGGAVFSGTRSALPANFWPRKWWVARGARVFGPALTVAAIGLTCLRSADLVSDRAYLASTDLGSFGAGLSWWFPRRAAAFIEREKLPGEIFNTYNEGGYVVWRLGAQYRDYIDGRLIPFGARLFERNRQLPATPPDSPEWREEAQRYGINTILIPVGRYSGLDLFPQLQRFCASKSWAPVYLDEVSAIFLRRRPENDDLIKRLQIRCETAPLPAVTLQGSTSLAFNQWANAAALLQALGRRAESFAATDRALAIFPDSAHLHFLRGDLLAASGEVGAAEQEYRRSLVLEPNGTAWSRLAMLYHGERRGEEEIEAWQRASDLLPFPAPELLERGFAELAMQQPQAALRDFDRAAANLPPQPVMTGENSLPANVAQGRALAWGALGDLQRAISFQEEVVHQAPERAQAWLELADLYDRAQRFADGKSARQRAAAINQEWRSLAKPAPR